MVSVVEAKAASRTLKLFRGDALEGSLSSHGHEDGEVDGSMGKSQDGSASPCCLGSTRVLTLVTDTIHCGSSGDCDSFAMGAEPDPDPTYTDGT